MTDWSAKDYLNFADARTRPAAELLQRVACDAPRSVVDLGCGPGNSTELLAKRWPDAGLTGIDTSPDMLMAARKRLPAVRFEQARAEDWIPGHEDDVVFANASLHWVADPVATIRRVQEAQPSGGWIAVQMPDNVREPSHRLMEETSAAMPFAEKIVGTARDSLPAPSVFIDALGSISARIDVWHTTYYHRMESAQAVIEWVRTTGLKPYLDKLKKAERDRFLTDYRTRIEEAYPALDDGQRLLAYPRFFLVARRRCVTSSTDSTY